MNIQEAISKDIHDNIKIAFSNPIKLNRTLFIKWMKIQVDILREEYPDDAIFKSMVDDRIIPIIRDWKIEAARINLYGK
jgi:hypothetical protein